MSMVNNLVAFRILYMLVTPFDQTEAFKLGVIDKDGNVLVKIRDQNSAQRDAYDMLDRLVFSLKRLLGKLPGGKSQLASLASAYYLVKEAYENKTTITQDLVEKVYGIIDSGVSLVEEEIIVEQFLKVYEDGAAGGAGGAAAGGAMPVNTIANRTGASVATDIPVIFPKKKKTPISRRPEPVELSK